MSCARKTNSGVIGDRPRVALTLGDVAGIGPEVIARVCADPELHRICRPVVFGNAQVLRRAAKLVGTDLTVIERDDAAEIPSDSECVLCVDPAGSVAAEVTPATVDARAGEAAYLYLKAAIQAVADNAVDALTTAPINKLALRRAGIPFPGHTELLADAFGVDQFAMLLYLPAGDDVRSPTGLAVAHATLHTAIANVPRLLTPGGILEKITLVDQFLTTLGCADRRIGVCALNPHAAEGGLFGDEEDRIIAPAVQMACDRGLRASGPIPSDTLLRHAVHGDFDGVVAMYHDQGHIALKLVAFERAVNVTLGLPIVRTSPSHGTAFDIAWQGKASPRGMFEAIRVAVQLAAVRRTATDVARTSVGPEDSLGRSPKSPRR
ncbi:MAG TPA: 4-hydroxythreonine-4-phosphate dehydrogenase PdxA [Planctomycetaceae bacterium]|nr:4-hydroxythreonine-4-phosphate dehydrogenase PdxA [Planctomycetaceae bacterium]